MARCVELEIRLICKECINAISDFYNEMADIRWLNPVVTPLEELTIYQEYREKAVEQLPFKNWEWVHAEFDRIYKDVEEGHSEDALPYI